MGNGDAAGESDATDKDDAGDREQLPSACNTDPAGDAGRCASTGHGCGDEAASDAEAEGPATGTL